MPSILVDGSLLVSDGTNGATAAAAASFWLFFFRTTVKMPPISRSTTTTAPMVSHGNPWLLETTGATERDFLAFLPLAIIGAQTSFFSRWTGPRGTGGDFGSL